MLTSTRTVQAAKAFFRRAVETAGVGWPVKINLDKYPASHRALKLLGQEDARWRSVLVRDRRDLNNVVEQDHRAIKWRCASMLGFKSAETAAVTIAGIELAHRVRKNQFQLGRLHELESMGALSLKAQWERALRADASRYEAEPDRNPLLQQIEVRRGSAEAAALSAAGHLRLAAVPGL
jgi:hypothetical protein